MKRGVLALSAILSLSSVADAETLTLTFAGSSAAGRSAQATFTFDNTANKVGIRIANTMDAAHDSTGGRDLSALFWTFTGAGPLNIVYNRTIPSGPKANTWDAVNVTSRNGGAISNPYDAEQLWAFRGFVAAPGFGYYGLSSAGLGLFGPGDMLRSGGPGPQPGGPDGTIVSPTGAPFGGARPQFRNYVDFQFSVDHSFFPRDLSTIGVSNVRSQFDTSLNPDRQVGLVLVPTPPAVWGGLGCVGLVLYARRRMHTS